MLDASQDVLKTQFAVGLLKLPQKLAAFFVRSVALLA